MGATIKLDLTSDVTHLIVGSTDSAKYRYVARSRDDVKVLSPAWLEALRKVWMAGDDNVDVEALEKEFRMPTLFGMKICLTGFDDRTRTHHARWHRLTEFQLNNENTFRRLSTETAPNTMAISPNR